MHQHIEGDQFCIQGYKPAVLVDHELKISQRCTLVAKKTENILACIRRSIASRLMAVALLCSALVRHLKCCDPVHRQTGVQ